MSYFGDDVPDYRQEPISSIEWEGWYLSENHVLAHLFRVSKLDTDPSTVRMAYVLMDLFDGKRISSDVMNCPNERSLKEIFLELLPKDRLQWKICENDSIYGKRIDEAYSSGYPTKIEKMCDIICKSFI